MDNHMTRDARRSFSQTELHKRSNTVPPIPNNYPYMTMMVHGILDSSTISRLVSESESIHYIVEKDLPAWGTILGIKAMKGKVLVSPNRHNIQNQV